MWQVLLYVDDSLFFSPQVIFFLSVFQAMLISSEGGSIGSLIQLVWTLWKATLDTSEWIFSAVEMCEVLSCFAVVSLIYGESVLSIYVICLDNEEELLEQRHFSVEGWRHLTLWIYSTHFFLYIYIDISFKFLLRKTNVCLSGLNASCAAIFFVFILHICPSMVHVHVLQQHS